MESILIAFEVFFSGFLVGYLWYPTWKIAKKVWYEAKLASQEWKKPNA